MRKELDFIVRLSRLEEMNWSLIIAFSRCLFGNWMPEPEDGLEVEGVFEVLDLIEGRFLGAVGAWECVR